MNTTVTITLIICITVVIVVAICMFSPSRDKDSQKLEDIRKCINIFEDTYFNDKSGKYDYSGGYTELKSLLNTIYRIS